VGDKRVIFGGSLFALAGNLVVTVSHNVTTLFAGRLLEGVGYLSLTVGAVTLIMRTTTGSRRSIALGLWTSHTAVGIGLTLSLVAPLAQHDDQWRWAFGGHAILMALLACAVIFLPAKQASLQSRKLSDIWQVLISVRPYRVAVASGASAFIQTGVMAALTVYLSRRYSIAIPAAAGIGTLAEVFVACGSIGVGHLLRAGVHGGRLVIVGGVVMLCGGVGLYVPSVELAAAIVAVCVFSLGIGTVNGYIWTLVPTASPSAACLGATSGLVAQATYLGVLLGLPAIFASFFAGGWVVRICLVAIAVLMQVVPILKWGRSEAIDDARQSTSQALGPN